MADSLAQALLALPIQPVETPYGITALNISKNIPNMIDPYGNPWGNLAIGLGSVLTSALLGYQARQQALEENATLGPLITAGLKAKTAEELDTLIAQPGNERLGRVGTELKLRLLENEMLQKQNEEKLKQQLLLERVRSGYIPPGYEDMLGAGQTPEQQLKQQIQGELLKEVVRQGRIPPGYEDLLGEMPQYFAGPPGAERKPSMFPGIEKTYDERRNEYIQQGISMGLTPNKASEEADKRLTQERAANAAAFKKIEQSRETSSTYERLSATAAEAMTQAGETGGLMPGARQAGSYLAAAFGSKTQAEKMAATKLLDSIRPDIVKAGRSPGSVSEYENKMLIGAGPSSQNTPEENARLIKGMALRAELERDYADFLEQYVQDKGDAVGADKLWNAYKQAEVFVGGTYNPDRINWKDYFAGTREPRTSTETEARATGRVDVLEGQIQQLQSLLSDPAVSEATKRQAQAKIDELLGQ